MGVLYQIEHTSCYNYEGEKNPSIERILVPKDEFIESSSTTSKILCMITGEAYFSFMDHIDKKVLSGKILLIPPGVRYTFSTVQDTEILVCRLGTKIPFCDRYSLEQLSRIKLEDTSDLKLLTVNDKLSLYPNSLTVYLRDGLKCTHFLEHKIEELFYLLRAYYPKKSLAGFFSPLITLNTGFSEFIFLNHYKVKTVREFAQLAGISLSTFEKRFKRTFNVSPYHWMKEQRAKRIFHEINTNKKTFTEISRMFNFSSPSQFNDFCKTHFGLPPGQIRKKTLPVK